MLRTTQPRRTPGTGASVKFAPNVYSHFAFSYFSGNMDNLLVGWRWILQEGVWAKCSPCQRATTQRTIEQIDRTVRKPNAATPQRWDGDVELRGRRTDD